MFTKPITDLSADEILKLLDNFVNEQIIVFKQNLDFALKFAKNGLSDDLSEILSNLRKNILFNINSKVEEIYIFIDSKEKNFFKESKTNMMKDEFKNEIFNISFKFNNEILKYFKEKNLEVNGIIF